MSAIYRHLRRTVQHGQARVHRHWGKLRFGIAGGYRGAEGRSTSLPEAAARDFLAATASGSVPACVQRFGLFELRGLHWAVRDAGRPLDPALRRSLQFNAGVFPPDDAGLAHFGRVYADAIPEADVLGVWLYRHGLWKEEEWAFRTYCPGAQLVDLHALEFVAAPRPWTTALEGRRVLVVSPFSESIQRQYEKRAELFPHNHALPELADLRCITAVQSAAGATCGHDSWSAALESMQAAMDETPFDVALIGAGAYGLPLAAHAKRLGKVGIQLGGITQLLFGIIGTRWERKYRAQMTPAWTRPDPRERPPDFKEVEGGCYW